ncbi:MAG: hypothetical protein AB1644_04355 [Candidatus Zixiibacteriota bacterium]
MKRKFVHVVLVMLVCAGIHARGVERHLSQSAPQRLQIQEAAEVSAPCILKNHNDTALAYYSGIGAGERYVTYLDPAACGASPTYPFDVTQILLSLFPVAGAVWPVSVDLEVWNRAGSGSCQGPGALICSQQVLLDSAGFALPHVGSVTLSTLCTVNGPFYLSIYYNGATSAVYPSVMFDSDMPGDSCLNWGYWSAQWYRWNHFFAPPIPGNLIVWGMGQPRASGDTAGCCVGLTGNVDSDAAQAIDISDLTFLVDYLFGGSAVLGCSEEANLDGAAGVDISDLTFLVSYLFFGGTGPGPCP